MPATACAFSRRVNMASTFSRTCSSSVFSRRAMRIQAPRASTAVSSAESDTTHSMGERFSSITLISMRAPSGARRCASGTLGISTKCILTSGRGLLERAPRTATIRLTCIKTSSAFDERNARARFAPRIGLFRSMRIYGKARVGARTAVRQRASLGRRSFPHAMRCFPRCGLLPLVNGVVTQYSFKNA